MTLQPIFGLGCLCALVVTFLGLGLGAQRVLGGRTRAVDAIYAFAGGWGVLVTLAVVFTYLSVPLSVVLGLGIVAGLSLFAISSWRWEGGAAVQSTLLALLCVVPALVAGASFASVQYDEFSQWLPNTFYLYANDTLPTAALPNLQTRKQGYPIGLPFVGYATSVMLQAWDDRIAKVLPLMVAAVFGVLLVSAFLRTDRPGPAAIAIGTVLATLLNPFVDPRLAVTTYSDVPTAFLLAAAAYALWQAFEDIAARRDWLIRAVFAALALVHLRETNIVLLVAMATALPLAVVLVPVSRVTPGWIREQSSIPTALSLAAVVLATTLAGFVVWRLHLRAQGIAPDVLARGLADWNWSAPRLVASSLLSDRLRNNPLAGGLALVLAVALPVAAVLAWRRVRDGYKRLLVVVGTVTAAQVALLMFSYIAVFSEEEVLRAASAWRYASHLGPLYMLTGAVLLAGAGGVVLSRSAWLSAMPAMRAAAAIAAVVAAQAVLASRWRIDCVYPHVRPGYESLVALFSKIPPRSSVAIVNAADTWFFIDAARLARVVATKDWAASHATVVATADALPAADYVIDLSGADPQFFRTGQRELRVGLHPHRLDRPPVADARIATTCPMLR